jgi:hypothetical protein
MIICESLEEETTGNTEAKNASSQLCTEILLTINSFVSCTLITS